MASLLLYIYISFPMTLLCTSPFYNSCLFVFVVFPRRQNMLCIVLKRIVCLFRRCLYFCTVQLLCKLANANSKQTDIRPNLTLYNITGTFYAIQYPAT